MVHHSVINVHFYFCALSSDSLNSLTCCFYFVNNFFLLSLFFKSHKPYFRSYDQFVFASAIAWIYYNINLHKSTLFILKFYTFLSTAIYWALTGIILLNIDVYAHFYFFQHRHNHSWITTGINVSLRWTFFMI